MTIRAQSNMAEGAAFDILFHDKMLQYRSIMPGIIQGINTDDSGAVWSVDVLPAIGLLTSQDGRTISKLPLPVINNCPLVLPYAPTLGFSITVPIKAGDDCVIMCADRSIDDWQLEGGQQYPIEPTMPRSRELTDAICIPCPLNAKTAIPNYSESALELRNGDGTTKISLTDDTITLTVGAAELILTSGALSSNVPITAPSYGGSGGGDALFVNDIDMQGNSISNAADVEAGSVQLALHFHDAPSGGGDTGPPEN